ncbi:MAG: DUF2783 domain-containing protein [Pseudomonadota bacterium]
MALPHPSTGSLTLAPNVDDPDAFYAKLVATHDGLSEEESHALNARLIFILANQIGDKDILDAALKTAAKTSPAQNDD